MGTAVEPIIYSKIETDEELVRVMEWAKADPINVIFDAQTFQPYVTVDGKNYLIELEVNHQGDGAIGGVVVPATA